MRKTVKRYLAVILSIIMAFSVTPTNSFAAATAGTYVKINTIDEFTTGKYVMIVNSGYAVGQYYDKWLLSMALSPENGQVVNPDSSLTWNITVSGSSITLTDTNGIMVKPVGGNENGITPGYYDWSYVFNNGTFSFKGTGIDTVTLASNKGSKDQFRAYRNDTIAKNSAGYPTDFSLYKLNSSTPPVSVKAEMPTASLPSGAVVSGSAISLSCSTSGSSIRITTVTPAAIWIDYTQPIIITSNTTIYAQATAPGYDNSDIAEFNYLPIESPGTDPTLYDPITTIPAGSKSVLDACQTVTGQSISVVGQLVYRFGNYDTANTAILEDVINGNIYAIQIYNALSDFKIGDVIKITGTTDNYGGVPQITSITAKELVTPADGLQIIKAQEFTSISELKALKSSLLSEWVVIRGVTLGTYNNNGSTTVTDNSGNSMPIYRAATYPSGVNAGEKVDLYACLSKYSTNTSTTDQLRVGSSSDYVITNDVKAPTITMPTTFEPAELGKDYTVSVTITDNVAVTEAQLIYTVNHVPATITLSQSSTAKSTWEGTIPGSLLTSGVTGITIIVTAKDKAGNRASSEVKEITVVDEPQVTKVTPDRNGKTGNEKRPFISVTAENLGTAPTAKLTLKAGGSIKLDSVIMSYLNGTFSYTPTEDLADTKYTAFVVITRADGKFANYEWQFTVGTPEYGLYFGQLHSHTTYSDGSGSLDDALNFINKINKTDNVDFVAFTDHSNYFDTKTEVNPEASLYNKSLMTSGSQKLWSEYKSKIANFNASSENRGVIALGGFEMTWSSGPGHINTWNTEGIVSRNNTTLNNKTNDAGMKAYYTLLSQPEGANTVSQFNHPGTTFGTFSDFAYWDPEIDTRITLVEVGNGEGAIGSGGYFPSYNYYTMALDKGWHVAPTNNQDNHKGKWGTANDARDVIISDSFTEQGIYDALKDRKVYATEDKNLEINYTLNDELMGTIIKDVPESLNLKVSVSDADDAIQKAEVIANSGRIVYSWDVNAQSKELSTTLKPDYSYYYIRVTQMDGDIAVTAPVWVGRTKLLGISNVESSTSTPVTGEKMTVKTTLFNSETADVVIKSLTYKLDGKEIGKQTDAGTIVKGTNTVVNSDFTFEKAKVQTINVEAVLAIGDQEYIFTKDLSLDIRDANKLVYIGIDGSHYNEYVAGNYKDSMGNFSVLAAKSDVRCVILNTSADLIAAAKNDSGKYKMLILTAPSRRNGTTLREPYAVYSDEEIAAIKGFTESGGSLVVCGWSDLYENYKVFPAEDHMAAQQNKLLMAVGATLRISDDGAYDDVLNAGGSEGNKARLYLTTYNWNNALTKDIVFDKDHPHDNMYSQRFSQYGGATIYAVDQDGNPTTILPSNISPVVYGHSSTYSKDCDSDGLGGNIPKYEYSNSDNRLMVLATETVTHANGTQSLVIVDGAAFMSNFEIQATVSDTNAELNYSNYTILQNLIKYVNPVQIDKIVDVQSEKEEGVKFTVEGIVTSNASGYDKATAFFDCIYLQDETAGINAFPVAGDFKVGQKVRIIGTTSSYQGERQLNVSSITLIDSNTQILAPKEVTAKQVNDRTYLGSLVKISGKVQKIELANGAIQTILVQDNVGNTARIFIDGYITTNKEIVNLAVGNKITAVGLSSYDNTFDGLAARIRIRDRGDIVCTIADPRPDPETSAPVTPKPTIPGKETVLVPEKPHTKVENGKANVKVEISEKVLEDAAKDGNGSIKLSLGKEVIQDALTDQSVKKGIVIDISIPTVKDAAVNAIVLTTEVLQLVKESGQSLTIHVSNADAKGYTISIPSAELNKISADSKELNLTVGLVKDTTAATKSTGVLSLGTKGLLPAGMIVTVPVEDILSIPAGKKVYVYHKNANTGALEEIPNNPKTIAEDGTLKLSALSGGDYVISTEEEKEAVKLVSKIAVSAKTTLTAGKKLNVSVSLPPEIAKVKSFAYGDPLGQEEAKITYTVSNTEIATISSNGTLTAKKKGTVKVIVTVTLENGQKKRFSKNITVK